MNESSRPEPLAPDVSREQLRELELLFELSSAVARARHLDEVIEAALDAVLDASSAQRASLLLFDEEKVARFTAWRGLSDSYRARVEGHSPWRPEDKDAVPIGVADVTADESLTPFLETILGEGIRAMAFIPLVHEDRVLGKFMIYFDEPHEFSSEELQLAQTIANHVAFAIQRHQDEAALRRGEERFRQLADSMPQIVWTLLPNGACDYINRQWTEYTGLSPEEALGRRWMSAVHPEDGERTWAASGAFERGEPYVIEHRVRGRDGTYRWFLARGIPVRDETGQVVRWFGTTTDIHEQKLDRVQLEDQARQLREADRRKDEFLAVLGHELRNPLAAIRSGVSLLPTIRADDERFAWVETMLANNVRHLASLLDDLLDLNRISRGTVKLRRAPILVHDIIERAIESVAPQIESRRHDLRVSVPADLRAFADATRLEQIAANLLMNAAKYTPKGGKIEVEAEKDGDEIVAIRVRDNGIGIPREHQATIFEPFRQVRPHGTSSGLGIGLALVKRLIDLHGGTVAVESEGQGSEFTIRLPVGGEGSRAETPPRATNGIPASAESGVDATQAVAGMRVLVIDDNEDVARAFALVLEQEGCEVRTANDGSTALDSARAWRPDAMLIDIALPDMSGHEIVRRLRADPSFRDTLLIAVSGYGHEEARRASHEAGFDFHIAKPAEPARIIEILASRRRH